MVANRVMESVRALHIPHATSSVSDHVSLSIGIATATPQSQDQTMNLVEMAEKARYQAKCNRHNQIFCLGNQ